MSRTCPRVEPPVCVSLTDRSRLAVAAGLAAAILGCDGPQSALTTAGVDAERIATVFWWMAGGGLVIWILVVGLAIYAIRLSPRPHSKRSADLLILGGGAVFPTIVLGGLLTYGLALMPKLLAPPQGATAAPFEIEVAGEQWWWRVRYLLPDGTSFELANELRLPVGRRVEIRLSAPDVIHSFWVPSLGGKIDMIPGRVNRIALEPTRPGVFRGVCAEFCGASHALMAFDVVVLEDNELAAWLVAQARPASPPPSAAARRGGEIFLASGCGACHAVRGTAADGVVGPDLTHVGSRLSLAAGTLENEPDDIVRWIAAPGKVKPEAHMPAFGMLRTAELTALATYMKGLR